MMKKDYSSQLLTVPEFAEALRVTVAAVRRWLLLRRINSFRVGKLCRIPSSEVERLLAEGARPRMEKRS